MDSRIQYRKLRAPRGHGEKRIEPPLAEAGSILAANRKLLLSENRELDDLGLRKLAASARRDLIAAAAQYTRTYRSVELPDSAGDPPRVVLSGHQPELFHAGVWFKNFVLDYLGDRHQAVAINLLIDSDVVKSTAIGVPGGSPQHPTVQLVSYDKAGLGVPHEERPVLDPSTFAGFGENAAQTIRPLAGDPVLGELWPAAIERLQAGQNLGACLAQSRHMLEGRWGLQTLEIPQSAVCRLPAFCWFVAKLLADLPTFWEIYNAALADFRRVHRMRSQTHPAPDLRMSDHWLEAPFWIWTTTDPTRRPVYVRQQGAELQISDGRQLRRTLPLGPDGETPAMVAALQQWETAGVKLRTRALSTTLFSRLLLGDLFLHGIGGAKYDQLTDSIWQQWLGFPPPAYLTVTASALLPVSREITPPEPEGALRHHLRETRFHPESRIDPSTVPASQREPLEGWLQKKRHWVNTPKTPDNAAHRHREITLANEKLQHWVEAPRREIEQRIDRAARLRRIERILSSREYAFCLLPEETLREALLDFAGQSA